MRLRRALVRVGFVDLTIQFIGASGLPKIDLVGSADPYFKASLDGKLRYTSSVKANTLTPVWNELWHIKNVPTTAKLECHVLDKDPGPHDDVIGQFHCGVEPGAKELTIKGLIAHRSKGTFWLKMESRKPTHSVEHCPPYTFDGPVRYSRHCSPTVGLLTQLNDERLYSTWKIYISGGWNRDYPAAQRIFGPGADSFTLRSAIKSAHSILYARTTGNGFGVIDTKADVLQLFAGTVRGQSAPPQEGGQAPPKRIKPAVYTYVIATQDDSFRFSETGAAFLVDFASKHALHANCAEAVRYSGEFHPRPMGGWQNFSDDIPDDQVQWELIIDNNSGTYAPAKDDLVRVQMIMDYNFPGITVRALDREDAELKESVKATREYALKYRGVQKQELEPNVQQPGEKTMQEMMANGELQCPPEDSSVG
ncbi:hypothetical protein GQ53DRAFT_794131 [Thozetella sp. PMI_491]|nr:hypothetical protein GQ53DRAFT_794131 [Thozetella sp. PMI_491]